MDTIRKISFTSCCAIVLLAQISCLRDSYWVKLSDNVTIGNDWIEIHPKSPLKAEKDFQWVQLVLEPPLKDDIYLKGKPPNTGLGILMPDGEVINPEIQVFDQYGNAFSFIYHGSEGEAPNYGYIQSDGLPRNREYTMIKIRSPRPIKCKAIYWFNESTKDWK